MTRTTPILRLGVTLAIAGAALGACGGAGTSPAAASPSAASSIAPATAAPASEAPSGSAGASVEPSASASGLESPSAATSMAPSGSPAARTIQVQAFEGQFMNPPVDPVPGTILTFRNVGKEAHEMVVLRKNDDATKKQTFDDLTKVNPADLMKYVTVVGVLAADPGQDAQGQVVLDQPGDYAIVDLLAKGTTTAPASPDPMAIPTGIPNLASGMVATFTVAPASS